MSPAQRESGGYTLDGREHMEVDRQERRQLGFERLHGTQLSDYENLLHGVLMEVIGEGVRVGYGDAVDNMNVRKQMKTRLICQKQTKQQQG